MPVDAPSSIVDPDSGADLLTVPELAVWARQEIAVDDPFALAVIAAASLKTRQVAGFPDWTAADVPPVAKMICTQLAKRTYLNPDSVIAEGGLGPIGGDRYVEDFARALEFTQAETDALLDLVGGEPSGDGRLWVQPTTRGPVEMVTAGNATGYYFDDSGSDWAIALTEIPPG